MTSKQPDFDDDDTDSSESEHVKEDGSSGDSGSTDSSDADQDMSEESQTKSLGTDFKLSCVHEWKEEKLFTQMMQHLQRLKKTSADSNSQVGLKVKGPVTKDFTPWWGNFVKPKSKSPAADSLKMKNAGNKKADDSYSSWFNNSPTAQTGVNWLCGTGTVSTGSAAGSSSHTSTVEDIEVPSIYDNRPAPKGRRALKRQRKTEREQTVGQKWFGMKAPDVDDQLKNDMELIQMRGVLDPKRFYKNRDRKGLPKYFQMGSVVDEGTDFYSSRLTNKQRKKTLVEELMVDANVRQYNKRKYAELQQKMRGKKKSKR